MMKKILLVLVAIITFAMNGKAQSNSDRLSLGVGCLYQNGLDLTLSYEHEGKYHPSFCLPSSCNALPTHGYPRHHPFPI